MGRMLQILLIVGAVALLGFMLWRIRKNKLKIEYAVFWTIFALVLVVMGVFPSLFFKLAHALGFQAPISMIFVIIFFILILKLFFVTMQISHLENKIDQLAQQIALDRRLDQEKDTETGDGK